MSNIYMCPYLTTSLVNSYVLVLPFLFAEGGM